MSTRSTIKYKRPDDAPGFHLFNDYDDRGGDERELPVHLELFAVEAEVSTSGYVHLTVSAQMARELGLLPALSNSDQPK